MWDHFTATDEKLRTLAKTEGMLALKTLNNQLHEAAGFRSGGTYQRLQLVRRALLGLLEENDDLLEGYLKVAGEAAAMEDKLDAVRDKHKRAEHACARMGAQLNAQRGTLLEAVAAAAGRKELT